MFTFTTTYLASAHFSIGGASALGGIVDATNVGSISMSDQSGAVVTSVTGTNCAYGIFPGGENTRFVMRLSGTVTGTVSTTDSTQGVIVSGATGKTQLLTFDMNDDNETSGTYYLYGDTTISRSGKTITVPNSAKISSKTSVGKVSGLRILPSNSQKNLFVTWDKVKKAKAYQVYTYDASSGKYVASSICKTNYLDIANVSANTTYGYRIRALKSTTTAKGYLTKQSYAVYALAAGSTRADVTKVKASKTKLTAKVGHKAKITATVTSSYGTSLLSTKVRWFSSNTKVAKVSAVGKVTFKKKGTCTIWAIAHDGVASAKVKVKVRK